MEEEILAYHSVKIDEVAPFFDLPWYDPIKDNEKNVSLDDINGKWAVLFYYPADFTFVCPTELKDLTDAKKEFDALKTEVLVVSTDTVFTHRAWVKDEWLLKWFPFTMLADHTWEVADAYNLLDYETGIAGRWTFIIDPEGVVRGIEVTSWALGRNSDELIRKIEALQFMRKNKWVACPARWKKWDKHIKPSIKMTWKVFEELN